MPKLRAVLFDIYGTLVDIKTDEYRESAFEALSQFLEYRRVHVPPQELKELYFNEVNMQLASSHEKYPEVDARSAFAGVLREHGGVTDRHLSIIVTQLYRSLTRKHMSLFEDTFWTLSEFRKQYRLGIVSDAQRLFCKPELRTLRLEEFFETTVISSQYRFRKPDPRLFHIALTLLNVSPSEAAYIGNSHKTDFVGAKGAGFSVVGLIHQSEEEKRSYPADYPPDFVADNLRGALQAIAEREAAQPT